MSQVQNNVLHNFIQPALFMTAAYFAGTKRFIETFPGATQNGLLLSAGIGSVFALGSQKFSDDTETPYHSLARAVISLALGAIVAPYAAKALKGRADITLPAALRLTLLESVFATALAGISSQMQKTTPPPPNPTLQEIHAAFVKENGKWEALSKEERSAKAKAFYDANLLPITTRSDLEFDVDPFNLEPDFDSLSDNQLRWYYLTSHIWSELSIEKLSELTQALCDRNITTIAAMNPAFRDALSCKDGPLDLLHPYYAEHPLEFWSFPNFHHVQGSLEKCGEKIPKINDALKASTPEIIAELSERAVRDLHERLEGRKLKTKWEHLQPNQQEAFNLRFAALGLKQL